MKLECWVLKYRIWEKSSGPVQRGYLSKPYFKVFGYKKEAAAFVSRNTLSYGGILNTEIRKVVFEENDDA